MPGLLRWVKLSASFALLLSEANLTLLSLTFLPGTLTMIERLVGIHPIIARRASTVKE